MANLIEVNSFGLYVAPADVYIDPWRGVDKAIITHAHTDHARWGSKWYGAHKHTVPILRHRLSAEINATSFEYGEEFTINSVKFSLHPAGHILGSAQVRVEYKGEVWVVSGDYKLADDGFSTPFEPIKCHTFITESTFGMPVFKWKPQAEVAEDINNWWRKNNAKGVTTLLIGYSLGKAQRLINLLDTSIGNIYTHGAVDAINKVYTDMGIILPHSEKVSQDIPNTNYKGAIVIAPPAALGTPWVNKLKPFSVGIASGWMNLRGAKRWQAADKGFALSDHADWDGLNTAIAETGAENVFVTHGYTPVFTRWLQEKGYNAQELKTLYEGEGGDKTE